MTTHYMITKALLKRQFDRVHPCRYWNVDCYMVQIDNIPYTKYMPDRILKYWSKFELGLCPAHHSQLEQIVGRKP